MFDDFPNAQEKRHLYEQSMFRIVKKIEADGWMPTEYSWADAGMVGWLVDGAAIIFARRTIYQP